MLEHTKKHHTDKITLLFGGPKGYEREAIMVLKALGFMNSEKKIDSVSWRALSCSKT